jgi:DNA-binding CsgD family transcriptional regulator
MPALQNIRIDPIEPAMQALANEHLTSLGIKYFSHVRITEKGYFSIISSNCATIQTCLDYATLFPPLEEDLQQKNFYQMLFQEGPYLPILNTIQAEFNLSNFIDLFDQKDNTIDAFCFGTNSNDSGAFNRYLNNLDTLEKFKQIFIEKFTPYLTSLIKQERILPKILHPSTKALPLTYVEKASEKLLTFREKQILSLYATGETARSIATLLNRSSRTIEAHLASIKSKLNVTTRNELIKYWFKLLSL